MTPTTAKISAGLTRQAEDQLDPRDDQHDDDHHRADDRPAQQVVHQVMLDDTFGRQYAEIGHA